ncbi:Miro-like protein [Ancylostoma caninum]|uniref:Miro-like protein n=1 Tax=Ancylostoma caninum TaxID=29170 RepID=A0A368FNB2_ANCCA|nr:Miro-like protein [Ancylostoma caninum]
MGRAMRVVVVGGRRVGKTAILRQVACFEDITSKKYEPTIDDTYQVLLEEGDRPREILIFHDTGGLADSGPAELKRPYLQVADAFVLVYSVADHESFNRIDLLKKFIEKQFGKDRKEVADAFVLVYSVADHESFNRIDLLKKFIEKQFGKDRKEVGLIDFIYFIL